MSRSESGQRVGEGIMERILHQRCVHVKTISCVVRLKSKSFCFNYENDILQHEHERVVLLALMLSCFRDRTQFHVLLFFWSGSKHDMLSVTSGVTVSLLCASPHGVVWQGTKHDMLSATSSVAVSSLCPFCSSKRNTVCDIGARVS